MSSPLAPGSSHPPTGSDSTASETKESESVLSKPIAPEPALCKHVALEPRTSKPKSLQPSHSEPAVSEPSISQPTVSMPLVSKVPPTESLSNSALQKRLLVSQPDKSISYPCEPKVTSKTASSSFLNRDASKNSIASLPTHSSPAPSTIATNTRERTHRKGSFADSPSTKKRRILVVLPGSESKLRTISSTPVNILPSIEPPFMPTMPHTGRQVTDVIPIHMKKPSTPNASNRDEIQQVPVSRPNFPSLDSRIRDLRIRANTPSLHPDEVNDQPRTPSGDIQGGGALVSMQSIEKEPPPSPSDPQSCGKLNIMEPVEEVRRSRPPLFHSAATSTSHSRKETRRSWSRSALEKAGISKKLLTALATYTKNVPNIPIQPDHSNLKKTRNMRGWIQELEKPKCSPIWDALMNVLRTETSAEMQLGLHWDHHLCRHILGVVVSENQTSHTRQAINNAIKRELMCPLESGHSTRGKTFRDLFRSKCHNAGVKLNALESNARPKPSYNLPKTGASARPSHSVLTDLHFSTNSAEETPDPHQVSIPGNYYEHIARLDGELRRLRSSCQEKDEWGQTAWWKLAKNEDVENLPSVLVVHSLFELRNMLTDFRWMKRTFECVDFSQGMRQVPTIGYDVILKHATSANLRAHALPEVDIESYRLIRNALMVIIPVLYKDPPADQSFLAHLATQLVGRLISQKRRFPTIAVLIQSVKLYAPKPWLRPLTRCFQQPRTDIALAVPSDGIFRPHQIVLSADGRFLVISNASMEASTPKREAISAEKSSMPTAASDNFPPNPGFPPSSKKHISISIWDVNSGKQVGKVSKLPNLVAQLGITKDNNCIIGETMNALFFWHFERNDKEWRFMYSREASERLKGLSSITPTRNPKHVLTTHKLDKEPAIALWNTETGVLKEKYISVTSKPNCVDVASGKEYFASGHDNGFIHLWNWAKKTPILTFKDEGTEQGPQQVVPLSEANKNADPDVKGLIKLGTTSISFFEKGSDLWLASISSNSVDLSKPTEVIRIWVLPPQRFLDDDTRGFIFCRRTAVWGCPHVRDIYWSTEGNLFTGGDDGLARMWERQENEKWKQFTMERDVSEQQKRLKMSCAFISCGKQTELVATYVTKSPYVVVWDMSNKERRREMMKRTGIYRPYFPLLKHSVDVSDMEEFRGAASSSKPGNASDPHAASGGTRHQKGSSLLRQNLEYFFCAPDKLKLNVPREQTRLTMHLSVSFNDVLRLCFDQPVSQAKSGWFVIDKSKGEDRTAMRGEDSLVDSDVEEDEGVNGNGKHSKRRGLIVKLENGSIEFFELEGERSPLLNSVPSKNPSIRKDDKGPGSRPVTGKRDRPSQSTNTPHTRIDAALTSTGRSTGPIITP